MFRPFNGTSATWSDKFQIIKSLTSELVATMTILFSGISSFSRTTVGRYSCGIFDEELKFMAGIFSKGPKNLNSIFFLLTYNRWKYIQIMLITNWK